MLVAKAKTSRTKQMKRKGNLYAQIISLSNLRIAEAKARKGKSQQYGVKVFDQAPDAKLQELHDVLKNKSYKTSAYKVFKICDPKERDIFALPYYPDRIVHHAIMNVLEPIFVSTFTADTYSCIKGRGIHGAAYAVKNALRDEKNTQYCLKLDITKFYPSIDHEILKQLVRKKIKDAELLWLLDEIIDSAPGLPIGNYLSQYLANYYLTYFDHWMKEEKRVRYYFRYADDLVILSAGKPELHCLLNDIRNYLTEKLKLRVKENYQVFPVAIRGIDFVGYKFYHTHILVRKSIKKRFCRMMLRKPNSGSIASYQGWLGHANTKNLVNKFKK